MRQRSNPGPARPVTVDWSYFGVVIGATFASHVHTEPEFESICTPQFLPDTCIGAHGRNHQTTTRSVSHFFFRWAGPRVCGYRRGDGRGALHEPARPAQGQVPGVDVGARAGRRYGPRHMVRAARYSRERGLAGALSRPWPKRRRQREQLGTILSLVACFFLSFTVFSSSYLCGQL